ncbi:hypothetical protein U3516DRAFT_732509 [Neocallimastix sp. 'constans']
MQSTVNIKIQIKDFLETDPSRLFEIEMKIMKLEIENDDFKLYLDNLNSLFTEYNIKTKYKNKLELKLNKVGIEFSLIFRFVEKENTTKLTTIIKTNKSTKKVETKEVYPHKDQINRVRNGKLPSNIKKYFRQINIPI